MRMHEHPDWSFVRLALDRALEGEDGVIRYFAAEALPGIASTHVPGDARVRWDDERIAGIVDAVLEIATNRALPFVQALDAIIDSALVFPEVQAAFLDVTSRPAGIWL